MSQSQDGVRDMVDNELVKRCIKGALVGAGIVIILVILSLSMNTTQVAANVFPTGTPSPAGYRHGVILWDYGATPDDGDDLAVASWYDKYGYDVQANLSVTPNWSSAKTRVAAIATEGMQAYLGVSFFNDSGTPAATDMVRLPTGVPTVSYSKGVCIDGNTYTDVAPDYSSPIMIAWAKQVTQSLIATFDSDANVAGYKINAGVDEESIPVKPDGNNDCPQALVNFEQKVSCSSYLNFVYTLMQEYSKSSKPVFLQVGPPCSNYASTWKADQLFMEYSAKSTATPGPPPVGPLLVTATPMYVGFQNDLYQAYRQDAWSYGVPADWSLNATGRRMSELGGTIYHYDNPPVRSGIPTQEAEGYHAELVAAAIANKASNIEFYPWTIPYLTSPTRYMITQTLGTKSYDSPAAWVKFRGSVYGKISYTGGNGEYGFSDYPGAYTHLANLSSSTEPVVYCAPSPHETAQAFAANNHPQSTPAYCSQKLQTPVAPESYDVLMYPATTTVNIGLDQTWQYAVISGTYNIKLTYLDVLTDTLAVTWYNQVGLQTHTITKTNSLAWLTEEWSAVGVRASTNSSIAPIFKINTGVGAEYLNLFWVEWAGIAGAAGVPSPTPTYTMTPSRTPTTTNTPTGTAPTVTPTAVQQVGGNQSGPILSTALNATKPNTNFDDNPFETISWSRGAVQNVTMLRWSSIALPYASAYAITATLNIYVRDLQSITEALPARVYQMMRQWDSTSVTWTKAQGNLTWAQGGAQGWEDRGEIYTNHTFTVGWNAVDITMMINDWVINGDSNYGLGIYPRASCMDCYSWALFDNPMASAIGTAPYINITWGMPVTVTPTPTYTNTPTTIVIITVDPSITPTSTPTVSSSSTPTPTPSVNNVAFNEFCVNPNTDQDLNGSISIDDRALELYNPLSYAIDLSNWSIIWDNNLSTTYYMPRYMRIEARSYKVIYSSQLHNPISDSVNPYGAHFNMPASGDAKLYNTSGALIDEVHYVQSNAKFCMARYPNGSDTWLYRQWPTLGRVNR